MPWGFVGAAATVIAADMSSSAAEDATAAQERIAGDQAALGRDQLNFNKQVYADGADARAKALDLSTRAGNSQIAGMDFATEQAKKDAAYREGTFQPLEKALVADAQGYDTQQRREQEAQAAEADVDQSFAATRDANDRNLARSGIAPGSGKAMSLMQDAAIAQATARAGAGTQAVRNVEQQGHARMIDAASLGRNLPANQATQQGLSTQAGTAASTSGMQAIAAQQSGVPNVNAGYAGAIGANSSAGQLYGQAAELNAKAAGQAAAAIGQLGYAAGSMGGRSYSGGSWNGTDFSSDEDVKSDTSKPLDTEAALEGIVKTPVKRGWTYTSGQDDGRPHDGPMAQAVRQSMGEAVAPGGKTIDVPSMVGHLIGGMQELAKRQQAIEKAVAKPKR